MIIVIVLYILSAQIFAENIVEQVSKALDGSHDIEALAHDIKSKNEELLIIENKKHPVLAINGYQGREREKYSGYDEKYTKKEISFKIKQPIYSFGKQHHSESLAKIDLEQSKLAMKHLESAISYQAIKSSIELEKARKTLAYQNLNLAVTQSQIDILSKANQLGGKKVNEIMQMEINKNKHLINYENAKQAVIEADIKYATIFGHGPSEMISLPSSPSHHLPKSLQESLEYFFVNNPSYLSKKLSTQLMHHHHEKGKSKLYPTISITADHTVSSNVSQLGQKEKTQTILINFDYDIPLSMNKLREINSNQLKVQKSHEEQLAFSERKKEEITILWYKIQSDKEKIKAYHNLMLQAKSLYDNKIKEYQNKAISEMELIQTEFTYRGNMLNLEIEQLTQLINEYELMHILDLLSTDTLVS